MLTQGRIPSAKGHRGASWWRLAAPSPAISSGSVGGGMGHIEWVLNISVDAGYNRTDLDLHAAEVAGPLGLSGPGTALFTAVPADRVSYAAEAGVEVWSTVGVTRPTWPADRDELAWAGRTLPPGTINTVVAVPVALSPSALVAAALTATEAKAQACVEAGVGGTGTASDALVVIGSPDGPAEPFGGVRSVWGARIALAVHSAVALGLHITPEG